MILTEWELQPGIRLSKASAELIHQRYARALSLTPSWDTPGAWDVVPTGYIGAIGLPDLDVIVKPKVPLNTVVHMLSQTWALPALDDSLVAFPEASLASVVAHWFVTAASPVVERQLLRRYRPREEAALFVRGAVDVAASMRLHAAARPELACRFDDHTPNVLENQALLAATHILMGCPGLPATTSARLHRLRSMLAEVDARVPARWELESIVFDRLSERYRPPLRIAEWVLARVSPELYEPPAMRRFHAFLVDMSEVFQRFVFAQLRLRLEPRGLRCQSEPRAWVDTERRLFPTAPDIVVSDREDRVVVLDTKYKRLDEKPSEADVYQVVTYCVTRGARTGVLIYPTSGLQAPRSSQIVNAGVSLALYPIELGAGREALGRSLDGLARYVEERIADH